MHYHLNKTQQLNCDIKTAWRFFSSPHNLSKITPPSLHFRVLTNLGEKDVYEGLEIDYKVSPLLGISLHWRTIILEVNKEKSFVDKQEKGPYRYWKHTHEFIPNDNGVLMKDHVEYELPFGWVGQLGHALFIRKKLDSIFDYRYQVLEQLFPTQIE